MYRDYFPKNKVRDVYFYMIVLFKELLMFLN